RSLFCRSAIGIAALAFVIILWVGCSPKEAKNVQAPGPTNQLRGATEPVSSDADLMLSERDAAMLKAGPQKPATEADREWEKLAAALQAPPEPPEWQLKEPTKEEVEAFQKTNAVLAGQAADKAKD